MNASTLKVSSMRLFFSLPVDSKTNKLTITEYILIACLGVFGLVLITIVILVVQITRLNKTVNNLKAASHR